MANYTFTRSNEGFNLGAGWNWDSTNGWLMYNGSGFGGNLFTPNLGLSTYNNGLNITIIYTTGSITNTKLAYLSSCGSIREQNEDAQRELLTTILKEATWQDGGLRTTLLEPFEQLRRSNQLNLTKDNGDGGSERDLKIWLPR